MRGDIPLKGELRDEIMRLRALLAEVLPVLEPFETYAKLFQLYRMTPEMSDHALMVVSDEDGHLHEVTWADCEAARALAQRIREAGVVPPNPTKAL